MDGFTGVGWFRPHASFYWMTAPGPRSRIPAEEKGRMVAMLGGCADEPKIVILDGHLRGLSPEVATTVVDNYHPTAYPPLWVRASAKPDCSANSAEVNKSATKSPPNK